MSYSRNGTGTYIYLEKKLTRNLSQVKYGAIATDQLRTGICLDATGKTDAIGAHKGMQHKRLRKLLPTHMFKRGIQQSSRFT